MNKATSDCIVNVIPIFTIFSILINNDIVHVPHHLIAMETILVGIYVLPLLPNYYIITWAGAVLIQGVHHCVIHHWQAGIFSIFTRCVEL